MNNAPLVSVLMPVYNAGNYLKDAINSIIEQSFTDFEFIIIDDGSTDESVSIIKSYDDKRIKLIENGENIKIIATLNKGISLARGKYIARMDADDISLPERLEKQIAYMESNPLVGLCGTFIRTIGLEKNYDIHFETSHDKIKFRLFFDTHFPHPAAVIRSSVVLQNNLQFSNKFIHAEDLEFWNRMAEFTQMAIIPEILVLKRYHEEQISQKYTSIQEDVTSEIRVMLINNLGVNPDDIEILRYNDFLKNKFSKSKPDIFILLNFIEKLIKANNTKKIYNQKLFNIFFAQKYWDLCTSSTHLGFDIYKLYKSSEAYKINNTGSHNMLKFFLKSVLKYEYNR